MTLVLNTLPHVVKLSTGLIEPRSVANVDISGPYETDLLLDGTLVVIDDSVPPVAPAEPFAHRPRRFFVSSTQPAELELSDVWLNPATGELKEMT